MTPPPAPLNMRGEFGRKGLHLFAVLLPVAMLVFDRPVATAILASLAVLSVAAEFGRAHHEGFRGFIDGTFGWMMRPKERKEGSGFCGATWVCVTAFLLFMAFPERVAALGMIMALVGDAAAALVGRPFGRNPWPRSSRTMEGTAAFIVTAIAAAALFPAFPWASRIIAAVGAASAELVPLPISDNLLLPFTAAFLLQIL